MPRSASPADAAIAELAGALQRQADTLQALVHAIPAGVAVLDADACIRIANRRCARWLRQPLEKLVGRSVADIVGPLAYQQFAPWFARALGGEVVTFERRAEDAGVPSHSISCLPLRLGDGRVDGFIAMAHEIVPVRDEAGRAGRLGERDPLTGLLNGAGLDQFVQERVERGLGPALACLSVDLDGFGAVNDNHGMAVGDALLCAFGERLAAHVREADDAVARIDGDSFLVVLSGLRHADIADTVATKILEAAATPFPLAGTYALRVSAGIGIAFGANRAGGWTHLRERADGALQEAKRGGRGRIVAERLELLLV